MAQTSTSTCGARFGLGLRAPHFDWILRHTPAVDWFEILSDNYFSVSPAQRGKLDSIRARYPISMHGVGLSIAGTDPLDKSYLANVKNLAQWIKPICVSDHLSWTSHRGICSRDLLPVAYTRETLVHVTNRIDQAQEALGRQLFIENPSAYLAFHAEECGEAEFLRELCRRSGCGLLLDVNNLFINGRNLATDVEAYLETLRGVPVCYMHLAGHEVHPNISIDTHGGPVAPGVKELFQRAAAAFPDTGTLLEWDNNLPVPEVMLIELDRLRAAHSVVMTQAALPKLVNDKIIATPSTETKLIPGIPNHALAEVTLEADPRQWRQSQDALWDSIVGGPGANSARAAALAARKFRLASANSEVGVDVYAQNFQTRIQLAARYAHAKLAGLIGTVAFEQLIKVFGVYARAIGTTIEEAPEQLATFLRQSEGWAGGISFAALADLATFQNIWQTLLTLPPPPPGLEPLLLAGIAASDWDHVGFQFQEGLRLVVMAHDVGPVVAAWHTAEIPPVPQPKSQQLLIYRAAAGVQYIVVTSVEAACLRALFRGASFTAAMSEAVGSLTDEVVADLVSSLRRWMELGLIQGLNVDPHALVSVAPERGSDECTVIFSAPVISASAFPA